MKQPSGSNTALSGPNFGISYMKHLDKKAGSTPGLLTKIGQREDAQRRVVSVDMAALETNFGISLDWKGRNARARLRQAMDEVLPIPGVRLLLFYGRNSSKIGIGSRSDLRQSDESILICQTHALGDPGEIISFFDYGVSGGSKNRPELDRLVEVIKSNWGCVLMVEDVDRLVRDEKVLFYLGNLLAEGGVRLYNLAGEISHAQFVRRGLEAAEERRRIQKRGNPLRAALIRSGAYFNVAGLGYVKLGKGQIALGPDSGLVAEMYQRVLRKESLTEIGRWLATEGKTSKSGLPWSCSYVEEILRRPMHIGILQTELKDGMVRISRPDLKIVDEEVFAAVTKILDTPKRVYEVKRERLKSYILTRKCRCPECGGLMKIERGGSSRPHLACARAKEDACGSRERFLLRDVEQAVILRLRSILTPEFDDHYLAVERAVYERKAKEDAGKRKPLEAAIAKLKGNIVSLGGEKEGEEFLDAVRLLKASLEQKEAEIAAIKSSYFYGYAASQLSSLSEELENVTTRSPFRPKTALERDLASQIAAIISSVVIKRLDNATVGLDLTLDFTEELKRRSEAEPVVLRETFTYPGALSDRNVDTARVASSNASHRVTDGEFARIRQIAGIETLFSGSDETNFRMGLDIIAVALTMDCSLHRTIEGMGLPIKYDKAKSYVDQVRLSRFFEKVKDVLAESRPSLPGRERLDLRGRIRRRPRAKLAGHRLLDLRLTQLGAPNRAVTDDEWEAIRSSYLAGPIGALRVKKGFKGHEASQRRFLNDLLQILREDATYRAVSGYPRCLNTALILERSLKNGFLEAAAKVLKELETASN